MPPSHHVLLTSPVFQGVEPTSIEGLLRGVKAYEQRYRKGELVFSQGEELDAFPVILKGRVRASLPQSGGLQVVSWFEAGMSFAEAVPVSLHRTPVDATCMTETLILFIPADALNRSTNPYAYRLQSNLMTEMSKKIAELNSKISLLSEQKLSERILTYLATLPVREDGWVDLPLKYTELAGYLSVNKTSLSRTLHQMEDAGDILMDGRSIKVLRGQADVEDDEEYDLPD